MVREPEPESEPEPEVEPRRAVDRAFVDLLSGRNVSPGIVDVAEALRTHRLAWAVSEAARTGLAVRVGDR